MSWRTWFGITERETRAGLANPDAMMIDEFGQRTWAGESVSAGGMIQEAAVYSAVRQISEAVGRSDLEVFRRLNGDEREKAGEHRSWRMLHDQPNNQSTANTFWATVAVHLLVWENAFIYKSRSDPDGNVDELWLMDPGTAQIDIDSRGRKTFTWYLPEKRLFTAEEILHIPGFSYNGSIGVPRAQLCRQTLATAISRAKFEANFYARGAKFAAVIEHPGKLGDRGVENLKRSFSTWHSGVDQMHGVPVLEDGATLKTVQQTLEEMQFVELRQMTLSEIAVMFQMPPAYLGASTGDSLTYATTESNAIQFVDQAVAPLARRIDHAVSLDPEILPQNVMYARFDLEGLIHADAKSRAETWQIYQTMGIVSDDYIAAREKFPEPPPKPKPVAPVVTPAEDATLPGNVRPMPTAQSGL